MQTNSPLNYLRLFVFGFTFVLAPVLPAQETTNHIKALLVTGGCCHDYANQKIILKMGIEARANVIVAPAGSSTRRTS